MPESLLIEFAMSNLLIKNAHVVQSDSVVDDASISISGGRIESVSRGGAVVDGQVVNVDGASVFPGFIDVHIHGAVGFDTLGASSDDLSRIGEFLATQGVTAWLPTVVPGTDEEYRQFAWAVETVMNKQGHRAARVLGVHYEGPFVNSFQCGALHKEHFKSFSSVDDLEVLALPGPAAVRMITLAPEVSGGIELIRELKSRGWVVSVGHTSADVELLNKAFEAGAHHMTHFMNAMPQLHHRKPGPVGWGLARHDVTFDMIADGVHLDEFVLKLLVDKKGAGAIALISDSIAAAGKGDGQYDIWGETIAVKDGRTSNQHGSIAGSVISMADAVHMMRTLGISDVDVARMASLNPARLLGVDTERGSIEVGKRADLVAIDAEGKVKLTVLGGDVVFSL